MSATPQCELNYFEGRGLAEIIRLTLSAAGIPFTENFLRTREQFLALKPELMFGQVPLLRIDGLKLVQSGTIVRYIARKANLLGGSDHDIVRVDELYAGSRDAYQPFMLVCIRPEDDVKKAVNTSLDKYLPIYKQVLEANGTGYLVGAGLTIADLGLLEILLATVDYCGADRLRSYPSLEKFRAALSAQDKIKHYIEHVRRPLNTPELVATVSKVLDRVLG
jgi:glutathione S-transferase